MEELLIKAPDWNTFTPNELISHWKEFRGQVSHLDPVDKIEATITYFQCVPLGSRTIDHHTPSSWPTPWEILGHKTYCCNSTNLMVYYTLKLLGLEHLGISLIEKEDDLLLPTWNSLAIDYQISQTTSADSLKIIRTYTKEEIPNIS